MVKMELSELNGFLFKSILLKNNLIRSIPGTNIYITTSSVLFISSLLYNFIKKYPIINAINNEPLSPKRFISNVQIRKR